MQCCWWLIWKKEALSKTKSVNATVFNTITKINKAKTLIEHILFDCKCKFGSTSCNSNQERNNETWQFECRNYCTCEKDHSWNPATCTWENGKYLGSIIGDSVIICDETISAADSVSTSVSTNVISTVSTSLYNENVKYKINCYILYTVSMMVILLLIITIIFYHYDYHYAKHRSKLKNVLPYQQHRNEEK